MTKETETQDGRRLGLVVLLDAIGTRRDEPAPEGYWSQVMERRLETLRIARDIPAGDPTSGDAPFTVISGKPTDGPSGDVASFWVAPFTLAFADTVLLTFESGLRGDSLLLAATHRIRRIFLDALYRGDPLRGSVSIGSYYIRDEIVLGPAIVDAAKCHESADWAGIILAPNAEDAWLDSTDGFSKSDVSNAFNWTPYDIPISPSKTCAFKPETRRGWALAWPSHPPGHRAH